jgi:Domain of unknown function DUF11/Fibronectin type III domain
MATAVPRLSNLYQSAAALRCARTINLAFVLVLSLAVALTAGGNTAMAQQTSSQFVTGLATPAGGLVLSGTAINPATGNLFRHLWTADANGLCRIDPDVDSTAAHAINPATCVSTVAGAAFNAGQLTFDPVSNTIYAVDGGGKLGIFVLHFLPDGAGADGEGLVDQANTSILAPGCGFAANQPNATSLGPEGNLYVGFRRNGNIMRINSPTTNPLPCGNVQQAVIVTGDRFTNQMAWVGHTLLINLTKSTTRVDNADKCLTPNANTVCTPGFLGIVFPAATPTTMVGDQPAGQSNGDDIYFGDGLNTVSAMLGITQNPIIGTVNLTNPTQVGGASAFFSNIGALALDASDPTNNVLYVADDPTPGAVIPTGRWWQVLSTPPAPAPPSSPQNVIATAGNASASLNWTAPVNHQPVTSYTVHNSLASNGLPVADITLSAAPGSTFVPTGANITGLVNGVTYQFVVLATNAQGSSPFSAPSNAVTPNAPTVPGAPTNVLASPGDSSANVSWTAPASDGGSPITSYTVSTFTGGVLVGTTPASGQSAFVFPLTNGVAYTFSVHANNAIGSGQESLQSAQVTPAAPVVAAVAVSMTGPASGSIVSNGSATYFLTVTNTSTITAPAVTVVDTAFSATVSSVTTTQGACTIAGTNINCNLGNVAVGASVVITVTLKPASGVTQMQNGATATTAGASSTALVTTTVIPLNQTTDLQVTGAAQTGAPLSTGTDTFTWQIKNGQPLAASAVVFTSQLGPNMVFQNAVGTLGATCTTPDVTNTFTCSLPTLNGGQAMIVTVIVGFNASGPMTTTGRVDFAGTDNNAANNSASITVGVK